MKTDTIADMLTRIRNGCASKNKYVRVPLTRLTKKIAHILWEEKFILSYEEYNRDGSRGTSPLKEHSKSLWGGTLILRLKYVKIGLERESFIGGLQRISKTSRREYTKARNMPRLLGGVGRYVLSTTRGLMTDRRALELGVGGEVLFSVYSRY